jgi:hypothetical protein
MSTLCCLAAILPLVQSSPGSKERPLAQEERAIHTFFEYRNAALGITFKVENGRVELTVPTEKGKGSRDEGTPYKADSMEEFDRLYPELAKEYELGSPRNSPWSSCEGESR